jgi:hypothetical protein
LQNKNAIGPYGPVFTIQAQSHTLAEPFTYVSLVLDIGNAQNAVYFRETVLTIPSAAGQIGLDWVIPVLVRYAAQAPVNGIWGDAFKIQLMEIVHQVDRQDVGGVVGGITGRETVHFHLFQKLVIFQGDTQLLEGGLDTFNADPLLWLRLLPSGKGFPTLHHAAGVVGDLLQRMPIRQQALNLFQGKAMLNEE